MFLTRFQPKWVHAFHFKNVTKGARDLVESGWHLPYEKKKKEKAAAWAKAEPELA